MRHYTGSSRKNVKRNKIANINLFHVWAFWTPSYWPQPPTNSVQCNNNAHLIKKNVVSELYNGTATDGAAANFWGLFGPFVIVKWGLECFQNERARFDVSKNAVKKSNRTKNDRVRKCWKLPTFTNPSSGGPDKWPRSLLLPPLLNLLKVGNSQYCITHCIIHCSWEQPYLIFVIFCTPPHF